MEEVVVMLEKQVTNWGMKITVLLYKFQLCLLADNDSIGSGVAILEVVARHPDWWKTCQVLDVVGAWTGQKGTCWVRLLCWSGTPEWC